MFRLLTPYAKASALIPAAASAVAIPAGDVVGSGGMVGVATSSGEVVVIGVRSGVVADTGVSGGAEMINVRINTAEEPYGYSPDFGS